MNRYRPALLAAFTFLLAGGAAAQTAHTVEISLTAAPAKLSLVPGQTTDVYAYNGTVPGPTLEFHEGDHVVIHFTNHLPVATTVHLHGLHLPANMDGSPLYPIPAGGKQDYVFTVNRGAAGTYWYHPHIDKATNEQVARGLYGAIIIRAADDPLPAQLPERLLLISDNRFLADGSVDLPAPHSPQADIDFENGREGNTIFVSGQVKPTLTIRSGEVQRWRIINASPARVYRLALRGQSMLQVGTDGGLFETPVEKQEIVLGVGERAEVLVRGTGDPGTSTTLQMLPYDRYVPQTRPGDWNQTRDLVTLQYTSDAPVAPIALPTKLRVVPPIDTTHVFAHRVITFGQGFIDGKLMDMHRVDQTSHLGATEIWEIDNLVGLDHPFHMHGFQFQVLDRNGVPEPYRSWKDTVNVPKHESVRLVVHYTDFAGKWMYHCHILTHEDHGMMGILQLH